MKRLAALALSILLALSIGAASMQTAEQSLVLNTYNDPTGAYAISYPNLWTVIDKETSHTLLEQMASGELEAQGMNLETLQALIPQMEAVPMVMFLEPFTGDNYNVVYTVNPGYATLAPEQMETQLAPLLQEQFKTLYEEFTFLDSGSLVDLPAGQALQVILNTDLNGILTQQNQYYFLAGERLFVVTFTHSLSEGQLPTGAQERIDQALNDFEIL